MTASLHALRAELGADPPLEFGQLNERALNDLVQALADARARRARIHEQAIDHAFRRLPKTVGRRIARRLAR